MATSPLCWTSVLGHTPQQRGPAHKGSKKIRVGLDFSVLSPGGAGMVLRGQAVSYRGAALRVTRHVQCCLSRVGGTAAGQGASGRGEALPHLCPLCPEIQEDQEHQPRHQAREPPVRHHCPECPDSSVHLQRPLTLPAWPPGHSQGPQQGDGPVFPAPTISALSPAQNLIEAPHTHLAWVQMDAVESLRGNFGMAFLLRTQ